MRKIMNSFTDALRRRIQHSETTGPLVTAVVVGLGAGMGAVVLRALIAGAQRLFFGGGGFLTGYFG
ncbi:MAG: hypothetical protein OEZ37_02680, partial [Gemmatimonadota bacterium]|nr:hypothetical protein [Gemmatimonadota bacterium]